MKNITIQSIEVVNFMCHSNLRVDFNKMITCIGGRNGSGKSAVMIALGILFGQRAKELDRGNSFKNLIKTGTNQAIIRVKINNHKNFKRERYGDFILIEKKIRENTTKMTVSNHLGKIFNLKKNELEAIVDSYNLKFENPLNFLTQEGSKKFLNLSSPKNLYDFYYVGTEFKDIEEDLEQSNALLKELKEKIEEANAQLDELDSKLQDQYQELKNFEFDPEVALNDLKNEEDWLNIINTQNKLDEIKGEIANLEKLVLEQQNQRIILQASMQTAYEEKSAKDQEEEISRLLVQHNSVKSEIDDYLKDKENIERKIDQIRCKNNTDVLSDEINNLKYKLEDRKEQLKQFELQKEEAFRMMQQEREENDVKSEKMSILRKQIDYFKQNAFDQNKTRENENVARIKHEMSKTKFKDEVLGPIYEFVTLNDQKWHKVASNLLRKSLTNFIVFNNEDKIKLYNIFNQLKVDYSVSQMRSKRAYKGLNTNHEFKTLLNVLNIKNEIVSNHLITMHNIEQIILIENRDLAHITILRDPKNVDSAYTPSGDRIKLTNGSLSDFRPRDDGYSWFEDKTSKMQKYENELRSIKISDVSKAVYNKVIHGIGSITPEIELIEKKLVSLEFQLEAFANLKEFDTEGLEKKLNVLIKSIKSLTIKKGSLEERIEELETIKKDIEKTNKQNKESVNVIRNKAQTDIIKIDHDSMVTNNKISMQNQQKNSLISALAGKINTSGTKPEIVRDLGAIYKDRKRANDFKKQLQEMIPKDVIEKNIEKLETRKSTIMEIKTKFEECLIDTGKTYEKRIFKKDELKGKNTEEAIASFREYTARSGYEGIMTIDHVNKELDLKMKVHNSTIAGSKSTLSGGERSFAGVCFLLSMWKCFKCPVKVLDEFDVFMDSLNRKMTIRSLFEFFKENDVQVILITPLDTTDLEDPDCDIKILKKAEVS